MAFEKRDRFGNKQYVVGLKDKKANGYPYGYVEIGNKLFRVDVSESNKDGVERWVTITEKKKNYNSNRRY